MQINGYCSVTNGNAVVIAGANEDWSDALVAIQYGQPVLFSLVTFTDVPRIVTAVEGPGTSTSGYWELTLDGPWTGDTETDVEYIIHKDFTPNYGLPLPTAGEKQWAQLLARALVAIDANLPGAGSGLSSGLTTVVGSGKTLIAYNYLKIPDGATLDIQEGGTVVIL